MRKTLESQTTASGNCFKLVDSKDSWLTRSPCLSNCNIHLLTTRVQGEHAFWQTQELNCCTRPIDQMQQFCQRVWQTAFCLRNHAVNNCFVISLKQFLCVFRLTTAQIYERDCKLISIINNSARNFDIKCVT